MARRYRVYVKSESGMVRSHSPEAESLEAAIAIVTRITAKHGNVWRVMDPQPTNRNN